MKNSIAKSKRFNSKFSLHMSSAPKHKIRRIFGRQIVPCLLFTRVDMVNKVGVYIAFSHTECEIYDKDWSTCLHTFTLSNSNVKMEQDGCIRVNYTKVSHEKTHKKEFYIQYDRPDILINLFGSGSDARKQVDDEGMTVIDQPEVLSFCCGLSKNVAIEKFKPLVEAQARKRVMFLTSSSEICDSLILAIAIEFRMRFPQIEPEKWAEAFDVLWFEFIAFIVSLYTQCLNTSIEPHTGPNSFEYFRRLTASISAVIAKGADVFNVDRREFLISIRKFLDTNEITNIPANARDILSKVELALGNVRKRWILQLTDIFEFAQLLSATIALGQSLVGDITKGTKNKARDNDEYTNLASMLTSWAVSLVDNITRGPSLSEFQASVEKVAIFTVKLIDAQRYSPDFHCALALWKLSELVKASNE